MRNMPTWEQFLAGKQKVNESMSDLKKDADLQLKTGDFVTDDTVGSRLDDEYQNDPKEYKKQQDFLKGLNKPDPIPKNGWFVVDEQTGQVWHNNKWNMPARIELEDAVVETEKAAQILANVVSGKIYAAENVFKEFFKSKTDDRLAKYGLDKPPVAKADPKDVAAASAGDQAALKNVTDQAKANIKARGGVGPIVRQKKNQKKK
jgi:hypothetical protein